VAFKQFGDRVSRDNSFLQAVSNDASEAREMSSRLNTTQARSERADATLSDRISFANQVSTAYSKGEAISIDIAQDPHNMEMFLRYAQEYGGNSAAAHALMSAELARQSLGPTRVLSDGSSLPASFEGVRKLHRQQRNETALTPDIQSTHRAHTATTSRFGSNPSRPLDRPADPPSPIRQEVQQRATEIQGKTASKGGEFDSKAEIVKTDDGTLESKRSLLGQSMKQIRNDASTTAQEVTDAAKDLFNRK
jgi:conjugal transfer mating pair stabilization protein TraG